jgi:hypothetical protein
MSYLTFIYYISWRTQSIIQLFQSLTMNRINSQSLKYHFMETSDWYLKIKWLVDETVHFIGINKQIFSQTLIYPSVTNWLYLDLTMCILLQIINQILYIHTILNNMKEMPPTPDLRSTVIHKSTISTDLVT